MCYFTCDQNDMQMHKNNVSKLSKCEPCHKHKQECQNIDQHKPYLNVCTMRTYFY